MSAVAKNFVFEAVGAYGSAGFGEFDSVDGAESAVFFYFVGILGFEGLGFLVELGFEFGGLGEDVFLLDSLEGGDGSGAD